MLCFTLLSEMFTRNTSLDLILSTTPSNINSYVMNLNFSGYNLSSSILITNFKTTNKHSLTHITKHDDKLKEGINFQN